MQSAFETCQSHNAKNRFGDIILIQWIWQLGKPEFSPRAV